MKQYSARAIYMQRKRRVKFLEDNEIIKTRLLKNISIPARTKTIKALMSRLL